MQDGLFWAVVVGLAAMVGVVLVQALRRGAQPVQSHPDISVYRDQLAEVERDLARGVLSGDEAQRLTTEVSRRLLDADRAAQAAAPATRAGLALPLTAIATLLAASVALYNWLGAPGYLDLPLATRIAMADEAFANRPTQAQAEALTPAQPPAEIAPDFQSLIDKLRAAVKDRPDDQQGLELLARNEAALGNFAAAARAQSHLVDLLGERATPEQRLGAAQMMIAAAGGYVSPEAEIHLVAVLQADPQNPMARYFSGLMFGQNGRPDRTFALWQPLLAEGPPDAPWIAAIETDIAAVAAEAGIRYQAPAASGPSQADMQAAGEMSAQDREAMIAGMVDQLETRLLAEGGPVEDWVKLIGALGVLAQPDRGRAALAAGEVALAADPAALAALREAAAAAGFAP
jgi:cytochrome c-type biogenesis protein CcmH